ncbi:MAG: WbqC family protein [Bacteroidales bacterium]|nr:WbqC family protein [Bacteroidales bacterium]
MILTSHQPYLFPYLAYWQLIYVADLFLIGDDFAFMKGGWIPRNRILVQGAPQFFRIEVRDQSCHRLICETLLATTDIGDKLRTLEMAYHKAPCFEAGYALAERILRNPERNLAVFIEYSIREMCAYLGIDTPVGRTSDYPGNSLLKREKRVYDLCHRTGADRYINAIGGTRLYRKEDFERQGIRLQFLQSRHTPYPQFGAPFVEKLSILDAVMFNPRERLHEMLDDYSLIDG